MGRGRTIAAGVALAAVAAGVGMAGYAAAVRVPGRPVTVSAAAPPAAAAAPAPAAAPFEPLDRVAGGEVRVRDESGAWVTKTFAHGTLEALGPPLRVARPDGLTVTVGTDADTRTVGVASLDELRVGAWVAVVAEDGVADVVVALTAEQERQVDDARRWLDEARRRWEAEGPRWRDRLRDLVEEWTEPGPDGRSRVEEWLDRWSQRLERPGG